MTGQLSALADGADVEIDRTLSTRRSLRVTEDLGYVCSDCHEDHLHVELVEERWDTMYDNWVEDGGALVEYSFCSSELPGVIASLEGRLGELKAMPLTW